MRKQRGIKQEDLAAGREVSRQTIGSLGLAATTRPSCWRSKLSAILVCAWMLSFALMGIDVAAVLLLVFAYLFVQDCAVFYLCKYDKEM